MTHGVACFHWRDGRPRWIASRRQRDLGYKGKDLKTADGKWLPLEEAVAAAMAINDRVDTDAVIHYRPEHSQKRRPLRQPTKLRRGAELAGYIYAMVVGDKVKIGFSQKPWKRIEGLMTALPLSPRLLCIPASKWDEGRLHWQMKRHHIEGEWFQHHPHMMKKITSYWLGEKFPWKSDKSSP